MFLHVVFSFSGEKFQVQKYHQILSFHILLAFNIADFKSDGSLIFLYFVGQSRSGAHHCASITLPSSRKLEIVQERETFSFIVVIFLQQQQKKDTISSLPLSLLP